MASAKELFVKHKAAAVGITLTFILSGWLLWYFSDAQVIKRQLIGLMWEVSKKNSQESTMEAALKMRVVKDALAAICRVTVPEKRMDETLERDIAIMYLMHYRDRYTMIAASFNEIEVDFPAKGEAAVHTSMLLKRQKLQNAPTEVAASVTLALQKQDGDWLLTRADLAAALLDD